MQDRICGSSAVFHAVLRRAESYGKTPWPVLILGETGVGKELFARRIHAASPRRGPFVPVNCGAIPGGLFESELFGYERGAFSGAHAPYRGVARQAHGGTLFLDEIGEMELALQVKLLRLLESGEVRSLGSPLTQTVDVRIIAATNADLALFVAQGKFRLDLMERLAVLPVEIPALRERREDVAAIGVAILEDLRSKMEDGGWEILQAYPWPGNVRQLRNVLIRASVCDGGFVRRATLVRLLAEESARLATRNTEANLRDSPLSEVEKHVILDRLQRCHGNRKRTARELGIAKSTLHEKLRKWREDDAGDSPRPIPLPLPFAGGVLAPRLDR